MSKGFGYVQRKIMAILEDPKVGNKMGLRILLEIFYNKKYGYITHSEYTSVCRALVGLEKGGFIKTSKERVPLITKRKLSRKTPPRFWKTVELCKPLPRRKDTWFY